MTATHVVDRDGNVWFLPPEYDGGMVTRATAIGPVSAGIAWLEAEAGPLLPFDPIAYRRADTKSRPVTGAADLRTLLDGADEAAKDAAVRALLDLAYSWEADADDDDRWLASPRVSVSEAQELPASIRQARVHAAELRAALAAALTGQARA